MDRKGASPIVRRDFLKLLSAAGIAAGVAVVPSFGAPDAKKIKKIALIDQKKCVKCGTCFKKCPIKAISKTGEAKKATYLVDPKQCIGCGTCAKVCPVKAIAMIDPGTSAPADSL